MAERLRLLVVDDEERILSALRRALRREGYEILTAESAEEGLRRLEETPVDVIVSDHRMPGMSGVEFLAHAARRLPGAGRVLLTGWTESIAPAELDTLGIRVVPKPWDTEALKRTLRLAAGSRGSVPG